MIKLIGYLVVIYAIAYAVTEVIHVITNKKGKNNVLQKEVNPSREKC